MNDVAPDLDARALAVLDELLGADSCEREARLAALLGSDLALHDRAARLLRAAEDPQASRALARPLAAAFQASSARPQPGDLIAGYRLLRLLGEGGMATVWLAERAEGGLRREVALKLPLAPDLAGGLAERFARERDVLATLDHPNIARLLDAGVAAGARPYIVMEAVAGQPLTTHAKARQLTMRERVALFIQVLQALEHAHGHMVVHRDIKPSNILVTDAGQVKLLDFGIAKLLADGGGHAALTQDVASVLTPCYAAPEQMLGRPVTAATDIHAAGVVLYELLTGALPWGDPNTPTLALMQAVVHDPPRPPGLSVDLDTILLKALAKDPAQRYASVERFTDDLRRLLSDRPILARRVPAWQRVWLLLRRQRLASAAVLVGLAVVAVAGLLAWQQARETAAQRLRAEAVRDFVFRMVADAEPAEGRTEVTGVEMTDAAVLSARSEIPDPRLRGELLGALGHVYLRLQRPLLSVSTLEEALALLEANAPASDPALNQARAGLARAVQDKEQARATRLAEQVLALCTQPGAECAKARAEANLVMASCLSWTGREADSLRHARELVRETVDAFGAQSLEMASALEFLAGAALNAESLPEAAEAVGRAGEIARHRSMRATSRIRLSRMQAIIDNSLGHHDVARRQLLDLLNQPAPWYERAAQWRALASAEVQLGHHDDAMRAADSAIRAMPPDWDRTAQASLARMLWGTAASKAGRHTEALAALDRARIDLAAAGFADSTPTSLYMRRYQAEALLRAGRTASAAASLATLSRDHGLSLLRQPGEAGRLALSLGCAQTRLGQRDVAARQFDLGTRLLAEALPADHPLQRRAAELRHAADCSRLL